MNRCFLPIFSAVAIIATASAVEAIDHTGAATGRQEGDTLILANDRLAVHWQCTGTHLALTEIRTAGETWPQEGDLFTIEVDGHALAVTDFVLEAIPTITLLAADPTAVRAARHAAGWQIMATFRHPSGVTVDWRAELRDGSDYVRQILRISGTSGTLSSVCALRANIGPAQVIGTAKAGNPVASAHWFAGLELPMSLNHPTTGGSVSCELPCHLPLTPGQFYEVPAVLGTYPPGQLRRSFLSYLERERAAPCHPFVHYNGWFDFVFNPSDQPLLETIEAYRRELITKRSVPLDAFVLDDGWDDCKAGFWIIDPVKFPHQFSNISAAVTAAKSHFGIWISPLGGYQQAGQRTLQAAKLGLTAGPKAGLDLSFPPYYEWFRDRCAKLMREDHVSYFKFDKAGSGVTPHFLALLRLCSELRQIDPRVFINITVGTWPSPFWLNHIDSTWRDGQDIGYEGPGNERERWITYRDAQTWRGVVSKGPLYPLNSIMIHGIILSDGLAAQQALKGGTDLRHEARSYMASGTALQELYVKPSLTPPETWDQLAEALRWGRANADLLVDTHWVGGDPSNGANIYGWAAWSPRKSILTLRNPAAVEKSITVDIRKILELPSGAATRYTVTSAYADTPSPIDKADADHPLTLILKPFEVLVLELTP